MIRPLLASALLAAATTATAQGAPRPSLETITQQARAAREAGDYPAYLRAIEVLRAMLPASPVTEYSLARAYTLNGRKAEALAILNSLADAGWGFDATGDSVLDGLKSEPTFKTIASKLAANAQPRGSATPWRTLALAGKQPEGIAATADGTLYVGALRDGIYRIGDAVLTHLYSPAAGWGVVGLRVDSPQGELIACLSDQAAGKGRLVRLALPDLAERAAVDLPAAGAFCNDSAVLSDGRVALTDSTGGRLWLAGRTTIAEVKTDKPLTYPNGIAFSGGRLYVADAGGLRTVDPATGASTEVMASSTGLIGFDGLIAHDGSLFAVQNGTQPIRILRLTPRGGATVDVEVLASGHATLNGATTSAVLGDRLLVLAQTGIPSGSQPDDPLLVAVPLKPQPALFPAPG